MKGKSREKQDPEEAWEKLVTALVEVGHLSNKEVDEELRFFEVDLEDRTLIDILSLVDDKGAEASHLPPSTLPTLNHPPVHQFFHNLNRLSEKDKRILARQKEWLVENARKRQKKETGKDDA